MSTADEILVKIVAQTDQLKAGMAEAAATVQATQDEMAATVSAAAARSSAATAAAAESATAMQRQIEAITQSTRAIDWQDGVLNAEGLKTGTNHIKQVYAGMFKSLEEQEQNALAATIAWNANFSQQIEDAANTARFKKIAAEAVQNAKVQEDAFNSERTAAAASSAEVAAASSAVATSTDAMSASLASGVSAFAAFDNIQKDSVKTAEQVVAAQKVINAAEASGAFTAEELAEKQAFVSAAAEKVGTDIREAAAGVNIFTRNSRTMYSTSALITDAMTGQFSRMKREVAALANETGAMAAVFRAAVGPIGAVVATIAAISIAGIEAGESFGRFEQAAMQTGDATGYSAGQLQIMAQDLGQVTGKTFDASEAVRNLAASGRFVGDQLRQAAEAAVNFAAMTGEKVSEAEATITKLREDPLKAVVALNDQFHFLTLAEYEQMQQLAKEGDATGAAMIAINALGAVSKQRTQDMAAHANVVVHAWDDVKNAFEQAAEVMGERINVKLGGGDTAEKLAVAVQDMKNLSAEVGHGINETGELQAATAKVKALTAQLDKETEAHKAVAQAAAQQAQAVDNAAKAHTGNTSTQLEADLHKQEADQKVSYANRLQFDLNYWNGILANAKAGSAQYVDAWKHMQDLQKQLDDQQLAESTKAERAREALDKKEAAVAKQTAEGRAREIAQADQEIYQEIQKQGRAYDQANRKIEAANKRRAEETLRLNHQIERSYEQTYRRIGMSVMQSLNGMVFYHETARQAIAEIGMEILQQGERQLVEQVAHHIAAEQVKTATTIVGNQERVAADAAGQAESLAIQGASAIKWILTEAAKAAAGAFNAMVSIPYIGPFVAVGASIAAFAAVAKLVGSVASAEGGWERVPADGMMTQLHKNEMVLPAHIAEPMRQMAKSGGAAGGVHHHHYHMLDVKTGLDYLKRNPSMFAKAAAHAGRNGW